jgi:hypothetical protein
MRFWPAVLVLVAWGCHTFSGGDGAPSETTDGGSDAGTGSPEAGTSGDGAVQDAGVQGCPNLAPVIVADGGEDTHCGGPGTDTQLLTSNLNCGSCGHACAPDLQCTNGMCALPDIPTTRGPYNVVSGGDGNGLYVSSADLNCATDGGSDLTSFVNGAPVVGAQVTGECYGHVDIVDDQIFVASTKGIRQGALSGFQGGMLVPGSLPTGTVTATRKTLFWVTGSIPELSFLPRGGGTPVHLSYSTNYLPHRIASDGDTVYWAVVDQPSPAKATLYRRADATGDIERLVGDLSTPVSIALDADYVYLGTTDGQILRAPKNDQGAVAPVAAIVGPRPNLVGLAVDDAWVYAIGSGAPFPDDKSVDVWRAPKCGGRASKIGFFAQATVDRLVNLPDRLALPNVGRNLAIHFLGK